MAKIHNITHQAGGKAAQQYAPIFPADDPVTEILELLRLSDWVLRQNQTDLTAAVFDLHDQIRMQLDKIAMTQPSAGAIDLNVRIALN
jgi:hypothetical protein